ncbi:MAG TPA: MBL fold metallo-hydrolase [Gemmatimonadota bacterium]|nr:MBL fold metallo-hydrolase [Gemmatimonadota bacterium]
MHRSYAVLCVGLLALGHPDSRAFADQPTSGTRLILLGTAGGPSPKQTRSAPANAVVVDDAVYVVDAGNGVARQLVLAGLPPRHLRAVFITHHHSDHNADYGNLMLLAWTTGLRTPVDTYGPPPLARMTELFLALNAPDIELRQDEEGQPVLAELIRPHEIEADGVIYEDENVKVTAFEVIHLGARAYGFRFDTPDRSIVFSGDTSPSKNLIEHARGADVLVHEVVSVPAVDALVARIDAGNEALRSHIINAHTPLTEVGRIATEAGVKTLVLTHFVPSDGPDDQAELWRKGARQHFSGEVIIGEDLMEVRPAP